MKKGFFTDATVCIGCKACEVACKQWNQLPADGFEFSGWSYDNTRALGASTWRHVTFVETEEPLSWQFNSDVCKHCERAACLEVCPTGAIMRTEFGSVYIQPDICNGCGYCIPACPFGVVDRHPTDKRAWKCTLCYDRLQDDMTPACAQACPTQSIQFGDLDELHERAGQRLQHLHAHGMTDAQLYGVDQPGTEGLHAFFLLPDKPEKFNLPPDPVVPTKRVGPTWAIAALSALAMIAAAKLAVKA